MSEEVLAEDQSHYEISLTAGQAFVAFVLLLLSIAASFGFGLMIGKGQGDERLIVRKDPAVVNEARANSKKSSGRIVELGVPDEDFQKAQTPKSDPSPAPPLVTEEPSTPAPPSTDPGAMSSASGPSAGSAGTVPPVSPQGGAIQQTSPKSDGVHGTVVSHAPSPQTMPPPASGNSLPAAARRGPAYAQLLSTVDQKTAEALAASLINGGFTSAYVERGVLPRGTTYRVRVKFSSEAEAHAAEPKLKGFSNEVWITR
jgi:hypothetical protein